MSSATIPVTIVTGFLGAGKSTLLNYILSEKHGLRIAVVENEFSEEVGIESLILKNGLGGPAADGFFELSNGCLCCTNRDDLVATLDRLMARRKDFDYVLIETSGLADPGPVAGAFWSDPGSLLVLDGIVCVVDSGRVVAQTQEVRAKGAMNEAARQLAYADVVLLNKEDTVEGGGLARARQCVTAINSAAKVLTSTKCRVDLTSLLGLGSFASKEAAFTGVGGAGSSLDTHHPPTCQQSCCSSSNSSSSSSSTTTTTTTTTTATATIAKEGGEKEGKEAHIHDPGITTVLLRCTSPVSKEAFMHWVASLLWGGGGYGGPQTTPKPRILRGKGVLAVKAEGGGGGVEPTKAIFQSVEDHFDVEDALGVEGLWKLGEVQETKVIIIGWGINKVTLQAGLEECAGV